MSALDEKSHGKSRDEVFHTTADHRLTSERVDKAPLRQHDTSATPAFPERQREARRHDHDARPALLGLTATPDFDVSSWPRVRVVDTDFAGIVELPLVGVVPTPGAVLIRPDGYVAWAGELGDPDLTRSLDTWFGHR